MDNNTMLESDYSDLFNKFSKELEIWSETSEIPHKASQDLKYYFKLRGKRLQKFNLKYNLKLENWGNDQVTSLHKVSSFIDNLPGLNLGKYNIFRNFKTYSEKIIYIYKGKEIFRNIEPITLYQTIYDINKNNNEIGENPYTCPNCGAVSKIKSLQDEGCPYCRTKFVISDLFPKVINFSKRVINFSEAENNASDENNSEKKFKMFIFIPPVVVFIISLTISLFLMAFSEMNKVLLIGLALFISTSLAFLAFFVSVAVLGFALAIYTINQVQPVKNLKRTKSAIAADVEAKTEIDRKLKQYDENFSYEYFEGKCLSLIRNIIFNEDVKNYPPYVGEDIDLRFNNIIDITYGSVIKMVDSYIKDDYIFIKMEVFLNNTYFINEKIQNINESVYIKLKHNMKFKTNMDFSISEVNCRHCGASFNAIEEKNCPFCHNEYKIDEEDWLVTELK